MAVRGSQLLRAKWIFYTETWIRSGQLSKRATEAYGGMTTISSRHMGFGASCISERLVCAFLSMIPTAKSPD